MQAHGRDTSAATHAPSGVFSAVVQIANKKLRRFSSVHMAPAVTVVMAQGGNDIRKKEYNRRSAANAAPDNRP